MQLPGNEAEMAMLRAQERARAFVASIITSPSTQVGNDKGSGDSLKLPAAGNTSKSSLKIRPSLQRTNSEPARKNVHFSTTNLVDIRQFERTQKPSAVRLNIEKPKIRYNRLERALFFDNDYYDDDDDSDGEDDDDDDDGSIDENCDSSNLISDVCGSDEDEYDEEGFSYSPVLKTSHKHQNNGSKRRTDTFAPKPLKGWTLLTPGFVPHSNVRVSGKYRPIVYLENLQFLEEKMEIKATVFVRNIAFDKAVLVRYSINDWTSYGESQGTWSNDIRKFDRDNNYDRFDVIIPLNIYAAELLNSTSIEICVQYSCNGEHFWDNNNGKNYQIFLRHQKLLSSKSKITNAGNSDNYKTGGSITSKYEPPKASIPTKSSFSLSFKHRNFSYPTNSYGEERSRDINLSDISLEGDDDNLKGAALIVVTNRDSASKRSEAAKLDDPFANRYSFNTSYNPKGSSGDISKKIETGGHAQSNLSLDTHSNMQPIQVKVKPEGRKSDNKLLQVDDEARMRETWESQSYKDFVSKYCFYTPHPIQASHASGTSSPQSATPVSAPAVTAINTQK